MGKDYYKYFVYGKPLIGYFVNGKPLNGFFVYVYGKTLLQVLCIWVNPKWVLSIWETPKWVLLQTVKTQMKCRIMRHFIRIYTVC